MAEVLINFSVSGLSRCNNGVSDWNKTFEVKDLTNILERFPNLRNSVKETDVRMARSCFA